MNKLLERKREKSRRLKARQNLVSFIEYSRQGTYETAAHHRLICQELEAVERGEVDRLILCTPPRHGKSEIVSRHFPGYFLGRNPAKQIIATSYGGDLATDFGQDARDIINGAQYKNVFDMRLRQDSRAKDKWRTSQGGIYISAGIGGGITGRGMDLGIVDDPFRDWRDADSPTIRNWVWNWYLTTFYSRLMPGAAIIVIATRWHDDDLVGRLLKAEKQGGDKWRKVILPAIALEGDVLGRAPGEALWPAWYSVDNLMRIKSTPGNDGSGSRAFSALYQQSPEIEGGNIFKREWWQFYRALPKLRRIVESWDTAYEEKTAADYSCCTVWGEADNGYYLLDWWKEKVELPELKTMARAKHEKFQGTATLIEKKASGASLGQELKRGTKLPVIMIEPEGDKVSRAHQVTPLCESGRVFLPDPEIAPWVGDYIDDMAAFPNGAHDDTTDSTTQGLKWFIRGRAGMGVLEFYRELATQAQQTAN